MAQPLRSAVKSHGPMRLEERVVLASGYRTWQRGAGVYEFYEYVRTHQSNEAWWKGMPEHRIFLMGTNDTDSYAELNTEYEIPSSVWGSVYKRATGRPCRTASR